ncbi:thiamine pyrophosphate-dependent enzyme [Streptomyces sp. HNM0574]|uniref:thiamine pyrophosphate-dependent enzyme n=1 Tax=Streptomyces sp. HNM0574 TaxID=2714954 RepID=UPI00146E7B40|nr:thiamine pyrophosphate-dependent enzyme [Streptomyces sp. HNM0574]NLU69827.1 phosphonopyruvate decarboxylase [Streptomyces sp. HNM0574]
MLDIRTALRTLLDREPDALVISTCGYLTRDLYNLADRPQHFYLVGSMGMAAPVGLGVALATGRRVLVLDGDGSFAMNPGCLPMIAEHAPDLVHAVLDNGAHDSTGGQRTSALGDPAATALAAGYPAAYTVGTEEELNAADLDRGPALVHVRCRPRTHPAGRRVELTPQQLVGRFRDGLRANGVPAPAGSGGEATR